MPTWTGDATTDLFLTIVAGFVVWALLVGGYFWLATGRDWRR